LLIGLFAGGRWRTASTYLVVASLAAFFVRQPITILVKIRAGRRNASERPAALFWTVVYAAIGVLHVGGLVARGYGYLLYLAVFGVPVFVWHLALIYRREERRQMVVEIVGAGVLALAAPAAYWVGLAHYDSRGWLLFALCWAQSGASIVYAYLRLAQRVLPTAPPPAERLRMGTHALLAASANVAAVAALSIAGLAPRWLPVPFALQWAESVYGTMRPAVGYRPKRIGLRQLGVTTGFTVLFILTWRL
jgi:hypothetical protein